MLLFSLLHSKKQLGSSFKRNFSFLLTCILFSLFFTECSQTPFERVTTFKKRMKLCGILSSVLGLAYSVTALAPSSKHQPRTTPTTTTTMNNKVSRRNFVESAMVALPFLTTTATQGAAWAADTVPQAGTKAPPFELPNSRGQGTTSLKSLVQSGKWTILYFYPGAFTQGCTLEARYFQRDIEEYRKLNTQIVGVSVDPPEKNAQFCSAEGLDFYMLSDTGGKVSKLYGSALSVPGFGVFSNRQTYIIDPQGNLKWVFTDVESRIPRHSAEVLEKLRELKA